MNVKFTKLTLYSFHNSSLHSAKSKKASPRFLYCFTKFILLIFPMFVLRTMYISTKIYEQKMVRIKNLSFNWLNSSHFIRNNALLRAGRRFFLETWSLIFLKPLKSFRSPLQGWYQVSFSFSCKISMDSSKFHLRHRTIKYSHVDSLIFFGNLRKRTTG